MDGFAQTLDDATGGVLSEAERRERQTQRQQQVRESSQAGTVGDALGPVLDAEKTDIEFWLTVAQTILLLIIARELRR